MIRAFKVKSCVYLFNQNVNTRICYDIYANGFSYSLTKLSEQRFIMDLNFISENKFTKELTQKEFNHFVSHIEALQSNATDLKPLVTFEEHLQSLILINGLEYKDYL